MEQPFDSLVDVVRTLIEPGWVLKGGGGQIPLTYVTTREVGRYFELS